MPVFQDKSIALFIESLRNYFFDITSAGWQEQQQDRKDAAIPGKHCLLPKNYKTLPRREGGGKGGTELKGRNGKI